MEYSVTSQEGTSQSSTELNDSIFSCPFNEALVHQVSCAYLNAKRQGTHAQKTRAEVRGGGKKPFRQKGMGRARAGSTRSPIWRGGGATFAVKPRDYSQKVNKKMYRKAISSVLSQLADSKRLIITDTVQVTEPKTRILVKILNTFASKSILILLESIEPALQLASRNVPNIKLCLVEKLDFNDLIKYEKTIITLPGLKKLEEGLL